jgi:hypothetical protein
VLERDPAGVLEDQRDRGAVALEPQREWSGPTLATLLDVLGQVPQHHELVLQAIEQARVGGSSRETHARIGSPSSRRTQRSSTASPSSWSTSGGRTREYIAPTLDMRAGSQRASAP